ncbi:MAG: riboflavin synthase, partial [Odoribacter splanchnicus]
VLADTRIGDSIATNGVCLTVVGKGNDGFSADVMPETMNRSNLGLLKPGDPVNLERALCLNSRLGGHLVAGHVDGTGKIVSKQQDENAIWLTVGAAPEILRYIVEKGSVAIDGVSLTIAYADEQVSKCPSFCSGRDDAGEKGDRRCGEFRKRYDCQICRETDGTRKTEGD